MKVIYAAGANHFYLKEKDGRYLAKSIGDSVEARADMQKLAELSNRNEELANALKYLLDNSALGMGTKWVDACNKARAVLIEQGLIND